MWFLIETDDESKIGKDEKRRFLLQKDLNIEQLGHLCVKINSDGIEVHPATPPDLNNPQPLFTSKVDARGRLTVRSDVRQRKGISAGDMVDVFEIEKVICDD